MPALYLIIESAFINNNGPPIKLGRTDQEHQRRLTNYSKGTKLLAYVEVADAKEAEEKALEIFNERFEPQSQIGAETFKGSIGDMIDIVASFRLSEHVPTNVVVNPSTTAKMNTCYRAIHLQLLRMFNITPSELRAPFNNLGLTNITAAISPLMDRQGIRVVELGKMVTYLKTVWGFAPRGSMSMKMSKYRAGLPIYNRLVGMPIVKTYESLRRFMPAPLQYVQISAPPRSLKKVGRASAGRALRSCALDVALVLQ